MRPPTAVPKTRCGGIRQTGKGLAFAARIATNGGIRRASVLGVKRIGRLHDTGQGMNHRRRRTAFLGGGMLVAAAFKVAATAALGLRFDPALTASAAVVASAGGALLVQGLWASGRVSGGHGCRCRGEKEPKP